MGLLPFPIINPMRDTAIVEAEIQHLETQIERLERGELDPELFKKLRLQYGIYSMRAAPTAYMVRVRVPLGIITPEQLEGLASACEEFTPPPVASAEGGSARSAGPFRP